MKRKTFITTFICFLFAPSALLAQNSEHLHEAKETVKSYLTHVKRKHLEGARKYILDQEVLSLDEDEFKLRLPSKTGHIEVNKEDKIQFLETYSYVENQRARLHVKIGPEYLLFFLKKSSTSWKINLTKSMIHSGARYLQHPKLIDVPVSEEWRLKKRIGYGTLTDCVYTSEYIFTGSKDGAVRVWNRQDYSFQKNLVEFEQPVEELVVSDDQSRLVIRADTVVQVWDLPERKKILQIQRMHEKIKKVVLQARKKLHEPTSVDLTKQGNKLMVGFIGTKASREGTQGGMVQLWDLKEREKVSTITAQEGIADVSISDDGKKACAVPQHGESDLLLWKVGSSEQVNRVKLFKQAKTDQLSAEMVEFDPLNVTFSNDDRSLYLLGENKLVHYYPNTRTIRSLKHNIQGVQYGTGILSLSSTDQLMAVSRKESGYVVFINGKKMERLDGPDVSGERTVQSIQFLDQQSILLGLSNQVRRFNRSSGRSERVISDFLNPIRHVNFVSEQERLITIHQNSTDREDFQSSRIRLWDWEDGQMKKSTKIDKVVFASAVSDDQRLLALASGADKEHSTLHVRSTKNLDPFIKRDIEGPLSRLEFTNAGHLLYGQGDQEVVLLDPIDDQNIRKFRVPAQYRGENVRLKSVKSVPDKKYVLGVLIDTTKLVKGGSRVILWDMESGEVVDVTKKYDKRCDSVLIPEGAGKIFLSGYGTPLTKYDFPSFDNKTEFVVKNLKRMWSLSSEQIIFTLYTARTPHHIMDLNTHNLWNLPNIHHTDLNGLDVCKDRGIIVGGTGNGEIMIWKQNE